MQNSSAFHDVVSAVAFFTCSLKPLTLHFRMIFCTWYYSGIIQKMEEGFFGAPCCTRDLMLTVTLILNDWWVRVVVKFYFDWLEWPDLILIMYKHTHRDLNHVLWWWPCVSGTVTVSLKHYTMSRFANRIGSNVSLISLWF